MTAYVRTPWGEDEVPGGLDYLVDEEDGSLVILNGSRGDEDQADDDATDSIAHYKAEAWLRVRVDGVQA